MGWGGSFAGTSLVDISRPADRKVPSKHARGLFPSAEDKFVMELTI